MTETSQAQNGQAPARPRPPVPADLEAKRQQVLDEITELSGPCIPYGPRVPHTLYPSEASAMLAILWEREPGKFARLRHEANGGNPSDLDGPKSAGRHRHRAAEPCTPNCPRYERES